tara:strand:+ start:3978 stop:5180 length:1203 start_codon:yes stop_codon:yes gene_type:complete
MVPSGWKITSLGRVCSGNLQTGPFGSQLHAHEYTDSGVPVLMPKDLIGCRANTITAAKIPQCRADDLTKHKLKVGDILFSRRGDVARFALIDENSKDALCGTGCLKATVNKEHSSLFLSYFLQKNAVKKWLEQNAVGQTMPNMNTAILNELPLMVASSKKEEERIAKILSTWDKAISTTERLIDNSKQQKKALMQQLLTGKKRLLDESGKPFEGEWEKVELGNLLDYKQPTPYLVKSTDYSNKYQIPVLTAGKTFVLGYSNEEFGIFSENLPVIIFDDFTTATKFVDFPFKAKSSAMKILVAKEGASIKYIFEAMQILNYPIGGHQRHWISIFSYLVIALPSREEQQKIISTLTNVDKETKLFERQLADLKQEKKALMQQLLTGKRRVKTNNFEKDCQNV